MSTSFTRQDGTIIGSAPVVTSQMGGKPINEYTLFTADWRGTLDLFINAAGVPGLEGNLSFRVYAHVGGVRALVRQFLFLERFPAINGGLSGGDPQRGKRDVFIGRVSGVECDQYEVCVSSTVGVNPNYSFIVNYVLRGDRPTPPDDASFARILRFPGPPVPAAPPPNPVVSVYRLTNIHGTLHQLWATNRTATDTWLFLFDDSAWQPAFVSLPPPTASLPRVPALYVPPNAKGVTSQDFGRTPGIQALWGHVVAASSSPTTFTYDATADIAVGAEIS